MQNIVFSDPVKFVYSVKVNESGGGLKYRLGRLLRSWAQTLDGRWSLSIDIKTEPHIGRGREAECINQGLRLISHSVRTETHSEALEGILRTKCSNLYPEP